MWSIQLTSGQAYRLGLCLGCTKTLCCIDASLSLWGWTDPLPRKRWRNPTRVANKHQVVGWLHNSDWKGPLHLLCAYRGIKALLYVHTPHKNSKDAWSFSSKNFPCLQYLCTDGFWSCIGFYIFNKSQWTSLHDLLTSATFSTHGVPWRGFLQSDHTLHQELTCVCFAASSCWFD